MIGRRYQLLEELGTGGMGTVYRAVDRLTGQEVALKSLTAPALELGGQRRDPSLTQTLRLLPGYRAVPQNRLSLAREFRLLASLRHPNVISVLDYGFDPERRPFYTMEVVEKPRTVVEAAVDRSIEERLDLLMQMLQALAYLHRRGVVHRDLKPSNVLVDGDRVRLVDFGLSELRERVMGETSVSGTIAYMPPEVLESQPATERSDLYSAGVIAHEIFAGEHPFEGQGQLLKRIKDEIPELDSPALDPRLRPTLARLLAKDPARRQGSVREFVDELSEALGLPAPVETEAIRESFLQAATFVGRDAELEQLSGFLRRALSSRGGTVLVAGESGVGKSRLVDELRILSLVEGALVLSGETVRQGGSPYRMWRTPLRWLALSGEVIDPAASVLKPLLSDLEELLGHPVPDAPELDPQAAQRRLLAVIEGVFRRAKRPIVVVLEDLQWAGSESLAVLERLAAIATELPLLVVGTYRDDERPDLGKRFGGAQVLKLRRLEPLAIAELAESMLGPVGREPELQELLRRETEGNIFFLVEVVRALAEEAGGLEHVMVGELPRQVVAGGVRQILQRRLDQVPQNARGLLELAAVAGRELDLAVMSALAAGRDLATWLRSAADVAVLEVQGKLWRFAHEKLRETLLADLSPERRRELHRRLAETVELLYGDDPERTAELAHHWSAAADDEASTEKAVEHLMQAGKQALSNSAVAEAMGRFERALEFLERLPATAARQSLEVDLLIELGATRLMSKGHANPAVGATLERARELCVEIGETARLLPVLLGQWRFQIVRGDLAASRRLAEELRARSEALGDPAFGVLATYALGTNLLFQGEPEPGWQQLSRSIERFTAYGHHFQSQLAEPFFYGQHPAVAALSYGGWALWCLGFPERACRHTDAALAFAKKLDHPFSEAFAYILNAWVFQLRRERNKCQNMAAHAVRIAEDQGFAYFRAVGSVLHAWAEAGEGDAAEAAERMRQVIDQVRDGGSVLFRPYFLTMLAEVLGRAGNEDAALDALAEALDLAIEGGEGWWEAEVLRLQGDMWRKRRSADLELANFCYRRALDRAHKRRERSLELRAAISLAELWKGDEERGAEARTILREVYDRFTEGFSTYDLGDASELLGGGESRGLLGL